MTGGWRDLGRLETDRRGFCVGGVAAAFACTLSGEAFARGALREGTAEVLGIVDKRVPDSAQALRRAARAVSEHLYFDGDVTKIWQDRLRHLWKRSDTLLVGITQPDALFPLTTLARDAGYRLVHDVGLHLAGFPDLRDHTLWRSLELSQLPAASEREPRFWIIVHRSKLA